MHAFNRRILFASLCLAGVAPAAQAAGSGDWEWMVTPYVWAASINTDVQSGVPVDGSSDLNFDDVLDNFDGIFEVHAEGQNEHWGAFADFTYLGLSDEDDRALLHTESDLDARLFEIAGVWSPGAERYRGLDLFAGLRHIDTDLTVQFDPVNPQFNTTTLDTSETFDDLMLGARYTWPLGDRWTLTLRGDGSWGDTEGTWNASAVATRRLSFGALTLGYRYLAADLDFDLNQTDLTMSGPIFGYTFIF